MQLAIQIVAINRVLCLRGNALFLHQAKGIVFELLWEHPFAHPPSDHTCIFSEKAYLDLEGLLPLCFVWQEIILKCAKIALVKQKPSGLENTCNNNS